MSADENARFGADRDVDALYRSMRERHDDARANGYRLQSWFRNERAVVLEEVARSNGPIVDVGCGSGLMLEPLLRSMSGTTSESVSRPGPDAQRAVHGLDFNTDACAQARRNGITVVRGDAFNLPFADRSVGCVLNCQFLNQQSAQNAARLIAEISRVLMPNGRAVLVWRNGTALIHHAARVLYRVIDTFTGRPEFPYVDHSVASLRGYAREHGLSVLSEAVLFPPLRWRIGDERSVTGRLVGASGLLVVERGDDGAHDSWRGA